MYVCVCVYVCNVCMYVIVLASTKLEYLMKGNILNWMDSVFVIIILCFHIQVHHDYDKHNTNMVVNELATRKKIPIKT
jgi:hypothetical protein